MRTLLIMDSAFNLQGELALFSSLQLERSFWGVGDFTLTTAPGVPGSEALVPGNIIFPAGEERKMMLIENIKENADTLTVTGPMLKGIAKRRVVVPPLSLPTTLWHYTGGAWTEITDSADIQAAMETEDIYQSYEQPGNPAEGMWWLDMAELAAVYNWDAKTQDGQVWLDLGEAQLRQKYQNFGWDRYIGPAESAYKHFAANNLTSPEDAKRKIPRLVCAADQGRGDTLPWQGRFDKLTDLFEDIGEATGMGWDILPDMAAKQFVFDAVVGRDYSTGGKVIVISREMGNASDVERTDTITGTYTTCYVGGAGEDENRMILACGTEPTGLERREMWAQAGSVDDAEQLRMYGNNKISSSSEKHTLTADVLDSGACRYERDWDVGDKVIVQGAGASMAARIISVTEVHEGGQRSIKATFGSAPVTASGALKSLYAEAAR